MRKENGIWYFEENWFLRNIWGVNFIFFLFREPDDRRYYPKNICSVLWGSLLGFLTVAICLFIAAFVIIACAIIAAGIYVLFCEIIDRFPGFIVSMTNSAGIVFLSLAVLVIIASFLFVLFKTTPGKVVREFVKALKHKMCPMVIIVPRN